MDRATLLSTSGQEPLDATAELEQFGDPLAFGPRADAHAERKDWQQARRDAETAVTLAPVPASSWLLLARAYAHTGYPNLAESARHRLLRTGPHPQAVYSGLYAECRRVGQHEQALEVCRQAVEADPDDHAAYFAMAHTMAALDYAAQYIASVLESAARIAPQNPIYRISAAIQLVRCSRPEAAYEHLRAAPIDRLKTLTCRCSAKRLLSLCAWARDVERSRALSECLRSNSAPSRRPSEDGSDD